MSVSPPTRCSASSPPSAPPPTPPSGPSSESTSTTPASTVQTRRAYIVTRSSSARANQPAPPATTATTATETGPITVTDGPVRAASGTPSSGTTTAQVASPASAARPSTASRRRPRRVFRSAGTGAVIGAVMVVLLFSGTVDGGAPAADGTSPCPSGRAGGIGRAAILVRPSAARAPTLVGGRPHPCPARPPGRPPRTGRTRQHRGAEALILTGATLLLGVLTLIGEWPHTASPWLVVDVATLAASAALMPLLSRHRVLGAGLQAVLAAVSPTGTPGSTMATIQVAWRERFTPAAALTAAGVGAHLLRWLWRPGR